MTARRERERRAIALADGTEFPGKTESRSTGLNQGDAEWADDPRWLLVQRILNTPDFVRSPRLSDFLHYICSAAIQNRSSLLNEQHIGEVVFGRSRDYDSVADTIVRSHALRLRRRLEQYALRAGKESTLRLEIPRGGYVPLFVPISTSTANAVTPPQEGSGDPRTTETGVTPQSAIDYASGSLSQTWPVQPQDVAEPNHENISQRPDLLGSPQEPHSASSTAAVGTWMHPLMHYRLVLFFILIASMALASALAVLLYKQTMVAKSEVHHDLWSRLFTRDQPTRIVIGDSGLVLFHAVTWQYVSLHDYISEDYTRQMASLQHVDPEFAEFLRGRRYTSMVDAVTLGHLLRLSAATPDRTLVQYARDMRLNDFKNGNLILLGAEEADPWIELFEKSMDFTFSSNTPDHHAAFLNQRPLKNEQTIYLSNGPASAGKLYAVIAFLPNLSATGNVLLMEGTNMAGTESAVDLALDDHRLLPLLDSIRKADGSIPHFEMLLESDTVKDSAEPARVVTIHTHPF